MIKSIIVFLGPSGSGKTTICDYLSNQHGFIRPLTCTTRTRRAEESTNAYMFLTLEEFQQKIIANELIEYVEQFGHYYGSMKTSFEIDSDIVIALTESGANKIKYIYPSRTVRIRLIASKSTLISRINNRGPILFAELQSRVLESTKPSSHKVEYILNTDQPFNKVCEAVDKILYDLKSGKLEGAC